MNSNSNNDNNEYKTTIARRKSFKKYYDSHRDTILIQKKDYNSVNKDAKKEYDKLHYQLRKESRAIAIAVLAI